MALGGVRSVSVRLQAEVGNYVQGLQRARAATGDLITELSKSEQQRQNFQRLGTGMIIAGAGIAAGLGLAAKAAVDWESAWAGVVKTVNGSDAQLAALEGELREMARTLPATHGEIAAVAEAAGQLGVATEDISSFTRVMIDLGESTNLTADEAATSIAQLMNVMGTAPDQVDELGSALVELGNNGASTERDIIQMAQRIAGAGAIVGATEADILALSNALASAGINVEAGGSAISKVLVKIASSAAEGGEEIAAFAAVAGVSADEFAAHFRTDPIAALNTFVIGLGKMNAAGQDVFGTLDELGLSEVRTRDALLRLAASGDLLTQSLDDGARAWDENIALTDEAERRYATAEARIQVAKNQLNDFAIEMGSVFLPIVADTADALGNFAEFFGKLPEPVRNTAAVLAALTAAALLLGGTLVIGVTRIAAYRQALQQLQAQGGMTAAFSGRLNRGISRTAVFAGKATGVIIGLQVAGAALNAVFGDSPARVDALSQSLERLASTGEVGGEIARVYGDDLDKLGRDLKFVANMGGRADLETGAMIEGLGLGIPVMKVFDRSAQSVAERMEALEAALVQMAEQGGPELASVMQFLGQQASDLGMTTQELIDSQFPDLAAVLDAVAQESGVTVEQLTGVGAAAVETAEDVDALREAFEELFDIQMGIDRATIAYKEGLRELAEVLDDGATRLGVNSQAGRDNRSAVLDQIEAIEDLRQANLDNGMSMGEANEIYLDQLDVVEDMLIKRGFEKEAVQNLIDTYRDIPEQVSTEVRAPFLGPVSEEAALYDEILVKIKDKKLLETIMKLPGAKDRLELLKQYRDQLNGLDGKTVTTTLLERRIVQTFGVNAPTPFRHGGITLHAQSGLLREAQVFTPRSPARFAFAEPATGGEAFVPKRGDRTRSLGILSTAAGWHGATVVPNEKAHPGYVLTEDGSWVPENFFDTTAIAKVTMPKPGFVQAEDGSWVPKSFYDTPVKATGEQRAAAEMLRAVRAGTQFFEDFSFRGMSDLGDRFNEKIMDQFHGPFTRKRVEAFLKKIIGGQTFDQGGWLQPGLTLAHNATGQPERVLPPGGPWQWHGQRSSTAATDGMPAPSTSTTYNVYPQRADFTIRDLDALTRRQDALARADRPA